MIKNPASTITIFHQEQQGQKSMNVHLTPKESISTKPFFAFVSFLVFFLCHLQNHVYAEPGKTAMDVYERYQLKPLEYNDVKLHGDLKRQFDQVCDFYYQIPNDDLLKPYRERAGLDAPGKDMGGVYVDHNPFGQFLAGYARMYAATKDEKYRKKAIFLMEEWAKTIEPDGFFFAKKPPRLSAYYYEKMLGGLLDIYYFCGNENALKYLDKITAWEEKNIPRTKVYGDVGGQGTGEWYTQSENLYRAYLYTGEERYKNFAEVWEYHEFWDEIFEEKFEEMFNRKGHHAYSHVNSFNSLAGTYLVKGNEKDLDTLKKAYDFIQVSQCFATGGFGPNEMLQPKERLNELLHSTADHFETQCGSWAGFKMTKYLIGLTGDAKYGDWTEKLIINGIGASLPMTKEGKVFYYSSYRTPDAEKEYIGVSWPCCSGTRAEAVPDYHNMIYFHDSNSICVAQFFASEGFFKIGDTSVKIEQQTKFPEEDTTTLTVRLDTPTEFNIKFRIPQWLASPAIVEVNGEPYEYKVDKSWGVSSRIWENGDVLKIKLPMQFEVVRLDDTEKYPAAILYGPVALAVKKRDDIENPAKIINLDSLFEDLVRSETEPLTWTVRDKESVILKPFYVYKKGEKYILYLDPNMP